MFKLKYKKLRKLLKNNSLIASSITETLYALQNIEIFLDQHVPDQLRQHLKPLNISGNKLVLMVDSPAWKSRLRFLLPGLEAKLHHDTAGKLDQIIVRVIPASDNLIDRTVRQARTRQPLSAQSRTVITGLAQSMDDSRLKASLLRLGRHKRPDDRDDGQEN